MVLWKLALLRRRILIFSPPPVGVVCYRGENTGVSFERGYLKLTFSKLQVFVFCPRLKQ